MACSQTDELRASDAAAFFARLPAARELASMGAAGAARGWHEANGGNASYRLDAEEAAALKDLRPQGGDWEDLAVSVPDLAAEAFLVSAAGSFMGKLVEAPSHSLGVVELDERGERFRVLFGLSDGARPTSELAGHLLVHQALRRRDERARVLYHAHPDALIALSKFVELSPRCVTRTLWKADTECILVAPEGVGVVPCSVPGSLELARASAEQMERFYAVLWAQHGLLCSGRGFDEAFGLMDSLDKAARVHLLTLAAAGGAPVRNEIADECLRAIDERLGLGADMSFLAAEGE